MFRSAESLIVEHHGVLLRLSAQLSGRHFSGLGEASRYMKAHGFLSPSMAKKFVVIDNAFNVMRHITPVSVELFTKSVCDSISTQQKRKAQAESSDPGVGAALAEEKSIAEGFTVSFVEHPAEKTLAVGSGSDCPHPPVVSVFFVSHEQPSGLESPGSGFGCPHLPVVCRILARVLSNPLIWRVPIW